MVKIFAFLGWALSFAFAIFGVTCAYANRLGGDAIAKIIQQNSGDIVSTAVVYFLIASLVGMLWLYFGQQLYSRLGGLGQGQGHLQ